MEWKEFTQYIIDAVMQNQVTLENKNNANSSEHRDIKQKES